MKVGDRLLCKKIKGIKGYNSIFEVGQFYTIDNVIDMYEDSFDVRINENFFSVNGGIFPNLYDYFYTETEMRKIKLKILEFQNKYSL